MCVIQAHTAPLLGTHRGQAKAATCQKQKRNALNQMLRLLTLAGLLWHWFNTTLAKGTRIASKRVSRLHLGRPRCYPHQMPRQRRRRSDTNAQCAAGCGCKFMYGMASNVCWQTVEVAPRTRLVISPPFLKACTARVACSDIGHRSGR